MFDKRLFNCKNEREFAERTFLITVTVVERKREERERHGESDLPIAVL